MPADKTTKRAPLPDDLAQFQQAADLVDQINRVEAEETRRIERKAKQR